MLQYLVSTEVTFCKSEDNLSRCSPPKLIDCAGKVINSIDLPHYWEWTLKDVSEWLENDVQLPQYKDTMEMNFINGRRLCFLQAHKLLKMGIHDFHHIKKIMDAIRKLFNIEKEKFHRSISLPIKYPMTLYLEYRIPTGPTREGTNRFDFFKKTSILGNRKDFQENKFQLKTDDYPIVLFGAIKRKSIYTRVEFSRSSSTSGNGHSKFIDFLLQ